MRTLIRQGLGGGATRPLSQIGILEGLDAHRIKVDVIAGTSIGAMYAHYRDLAGIKEQLCNYLGCEVFKATRLDAKMAKDVF